MGLFSSKNTAKTPKLNAELQQIISKANIVGQEVQHIKIRGGGEVIFIKVSESTNILGIPDNLTSVGTRDSLDSSDYYNYILDLRGKLIVVGGKSLESMDVMFKDCVFDSIDFSKFKPDRIVSCEETFCHARIKSLDLSQIDFSHVKLAYGMFESYRMPNFDVSALNFTEIVGAGAMFENANIETIDLSNCTFDNALTLERMFERCRANYVKLLTQDESIRFDDRNIDSMFRGFQGELETNNKSLFKQYKKDTL